MDATEIIKKLNSIDSVTLVEVNLGMGSENRLKIRINDKKDYLKWDYFAKKAMQQIQGLRIAKRYPIMTFVFSLGNLALNVQLEKFCAALDRKYYLIEQPPQEQTTIIAKVTNLCNIDCKYCYDRPFRDKLGHNKVLKIERLDKMISLAAKYAERVEILWHGGEPTVAGVDYYKKVYEEILTKYPYTDFATSIQTNGTLLNDKWYDFAKQYEIGIGSSYNATMEDLRGTRKDNKLGSKTNTIYKVLDNIHYAGTQGVDIGVIDVLTKENHKNVIEAYEFYKDEGVDVAFNEIHKAGEAENHKFLFDTKEAYEQYLKTTEEYFLYWLKDQDKRAFCDRYASLYLQILMCGQGVTCNHGGRCLRHWIGINSNGDLYPCDRPLPDEYRIGNIEEYSSMSAIYNSPVYRKYETERKEKLMNYCSNCTMYPYCRGNCPMKDLDEHRCASKPNGYACNMFRANMLCAWRALCKVKLEDCNRFVKNFVLKNCAILPQEIPSLLGEIGLENKFQNLDFENNTDTFATQEFKLFQTFNSPHRAEQIGPKEVSMGECVCSDVPDVRFKTVVEEMKKRAERESKKYERRG